MNTDKVTAKEVQDLLNEIAVEINATEEPRLNVVMAKRLMHNTREVERLVRLHEKLSEAIQFLPAGKALNLIQDAILILEEEP